MIVYDACACSFIPRHRDEFEELCQAIENGGPDVWTLLRQDGADWDANTLKRLALCWKSRPRRPRHDASASASACKCWRWVEGVAEMHRTTPTLDEALRCGAHPAAASSVVPTTITIKPSVDVGPLAVAQANIGNMAWQQACLRAAWYRWQVLELDEDDEDDRAATDAWLEFVSQSVSVRQLSTYPTEFGRLEWLRLSVWSQRGVQSGLASTIMPDASAVARVEQTIGTYEKWSHRDRKRKVD